MDKAMKVKSVLIVSGGAENNIISVMQRFFGSEPVYVIACDKGLEYCRKQGIEPSLILGDFDSFTGKVPEEAIVLPCEKDDTDTMYALKKALELNPSAIVMTCASGGRLDHFFCNMQTLNYGTKQGAVSGTKVILADDKNTAFVLDSSISKTVTMENHPGYFFSVFAATDKAIGVTISGAKYNVQSVEFTNSMPIGQSNEWASEKVTISLEEGSLFIFISKN